MCASLCGAAFELGEAGLLLTQQKVAKGRHEGLEDGGWRCGGARGRGSEPALLVAQINVYNVANE